MPGSSISSVAAQFAAGMKYWNKRWQNRKIERRSLSLFGRLIRKGTFKFDESTEAQKKFSVLGSLAGPKKFFKTCSSTVSSNIVNKGPPLYSKAISILLCIPAVNFVVEIAADAIDDYVNAHPTSGYEIQLAEQEGTYPIISDIADILGTKEAIAGQDNFVIPSDNVLRQYMSQPVEQTLAGTGVVYVDDNNFQREVMDANQPTMVLFYNQNPNNPTGASGVSGLAALTRVLSDNYDGIKVCAYRINEFDVVGGNELRALQNKYGFVKNTPFLAFFDNDSGRNRFAGSDISCNGGFINLQGLEPALNFYSKAVPREILD